MQRVDLELSHYEFFCPRTGEQILYKDEFIPSPAQMFCYLDGFLNHIHPWVEENLKEGGVLNPEGHVGWTTFKKFCDSLDGLDNFVMFSITHSGIACGPAIMTAYHCIDMNHSLENGE